MRTADIAFHGSGAEYPLIFQRSQDSLAGKRHPSVEVLFDGRGRRALEFPALMRAQPSMQLIGGRDDGLTFRLDPVQDRFWE